MKDLKRTFAILVLFSVLLLFASCDLINRYIPADDNDSDTKEPSDQSQSKPLVDSFETAETHFSSEQPFVKIRVNNIYDMAGNLWEWTMGGYSSRIRIGRGGYFLHYSDSYPVSSRSNNFPDFAFTSGGFRSSLYIKK